MTVVKDQMALLRGKSWSHRQWDPLPVPEVPEVLPWSPRYEGHKGTAPLLREIAKHSSWARSSSAVA